MPSPFLRAGAFPIVLCGPPRYVTACYLRDARSERSRSGARSQGMALVCLPFPPAPPSSSRSLRMVSMQSSPVNPVNPVNPVSRIPSDVFYLDRVSGIYTLSFAHDLLTQSGKKEEDDPCGSTKAVLDQLLPMLHLTAWSREERCTVALTGRGASDCAAVGFSRARSQRTRDACAQVRQAVGRGRLPCPLPPLES